MVALIALLIVLVFLSADYFVQRRRAHLPVVEGEVEPIVDVRSRFALSAPRTPAGVFFAPGHTWAYLLPSGKVRVGITDFARSLLGQVDEVEPRMRAAEVRRGDPFLRMRRGAHTATFRSPIEGTIERVNLGFLGPDATRPDEPFTSSWIYEIRPTNGSEIPQTMFLGEAARSWLKQELERLKVFLGTTIPETRAVGATLPDGGLPSWDAVDSLSDSDWQRLQERFFGAMQAPGIPAKHS